METLSPVLVFIPGMIVPLTDFCIVSTLFVAIPDFFAKYSAVVSSLHPAKIDVSHAPKISSHCASGYLFFNCGSD